MDSHSLKLAVAAGAPLTEEAKQRLQAAVDTHDQVASIRGQLAAFDWKSILSGLLPLFLGLIPGLGPLIPILQAILKLLNINFVVPTPAPNGGGGFITPTPMTVTGAEP